MQSEAVLAMWAIPAGYLAVGVGRPYAVWVLGSDIWGAGRYPLGKTIVRRTLRRASHVFGNSLYLVDGVKRLAGYDCEFLAAGRSLPTAGVPPADLPPGRPQFVFIGRWDRAKGVDVLLDAMNIVSARLPDAHLHLFGGGPLEAAIRSYASRGRLRERVTVYGFVDPVTAVAYCKACDALLIPSRIESIPVIYSDALQCGCPVVSTDVSDLGRLIREPRTGLVCPPEEPAALAEALCALIAGGPDARARYAEALSRAAAMFDPARCAEVLANLF